MGIYTHSREAFFFVHKPTLHIRFEDVTSVEFARVASSTNAQSNRTFDLIVRLSDPAVHQFAGIQRNEYGSLFNFMQSKKLRIENPDEAVEEMAAVAGLDEDEESSEDEDFVADEGEDEDEDFDSNASESGGEGEKGKGEEKPTKKGKEKAEEGKRKKPSSSDEPKKKKKPASDDEEA